MNEEPGFGSYKVETAIGAVLLKDFIKQRAADHEKSRKKLDPLAKHVRDVVNKSVKEYAQSPEAEEREKQALEVLKRGALAVPDDAQVLKIKNPGLKGALKDNIIIFEKNPSEGKSKGTSCKKGDKVIVHSSSDPDMCIVEVYEFEKKKEGKKEKDDTTKPKILHKGFAPTSKVKLGQKFVKTDKPLFEKEPCIEDVKQGAIGDCFLMAGLGSMVSKDPGVIKRSILDNGDGTITVRLFDKKGDEKEPEFEEKFITFEKSVLQSDEGDHAKDSLWVQMLEKAYAIHGASKGQSASYMQLDAGGYSHEVYEAFLGRAGVNESISKTTEARFKDLYNDLNSAIPFYVVTEEDLAQMKSRIKKLGVSDSAIEKILAEYEGQTFQGLDEPRETMSKVWESIQEEESIKDKVALPKLRSIVAVSNHPDREKLTSFKKLTDEMGKQDGLGLEDVEQLTKTSEFKSLTPEGQQAFRRGIKSKFSGPGEYTESDQEVWKKLEEGLKSEGCIAVSTKEIVGTKITSKGKSAGEKVSQGLVGSHAFSVTGLHEPKEGDPLFVKGAKSPVKYVRIRNPWGDGSPGLILGGDEVGRTYKVVTNKETGEFIKLAPSKTHKGEFCLELSDLTRRGKNMYTTPPIVSEEKLLTDKVIELTAETKDDVELVDSIARGILYKNGMDAAVHWVKEKVLTDKIHQLTAETDVDAEGLVTTALGILHNEGMDPALEWAKNEIAEGRWKF